MSKLRGLIMKRLVLAVCLVLAFSSAAMALNYQSVSVTLSGTQTFVDGEPAFVTAQHNNTLKINGSGTNWTANAEFVSNAGEGTTKNQTNGAFTLNDVYVKLSNQPFQFEMWNWGEDGQGVDFTQAPIGFVRVNDAPDASWMARVTTNVGGNDTVLNIKNPNHDPSVNPDYTLFTKRTINNNVYGLAYRTFFDNRNITDGWATVDVNGTKISGELAKVTIPTETNYAFGVKVDTPSKISVLAYVSPRHVWDRENYSTTASKTIFDDAPDKNYLEANIYQLYRATYTEEAKGKKKTYDLRYHANNDAPIGDMFVIDNDFFDINTPSENDWLKNTKYTVGVNLVDDQSLADPAKTTTLYATFAPTASSNIYAKVVKTDYNTAEDRSQVLLRGFYKVNDNLTLHPRYFINAEKPHYSGYMKNDGATTGTTDVAYVKDVTTLGAYVNYKITNGQLQAAVWSMKAKNVSKPVNIVELGYKIGL